MDSAPGHDPSVRTGTRVYLIGMMGCGKSAVGTRLAVRLGAPYLDNDALLAGREGADLLHVAAEGADYLHSIEAEIASQLAEHPPPFVAGIAASVIEDPPTVARLQASGVLVYLRARPDTLLARVRATPRPWLEQDPLGWITETLNRRGPRFAAAAQLVVDTDDADPNDIAETIADWCSGGTLVGRHA